MSFYDRLTNQHDRSVETRVNHNKWIGEMLLYRAGATNAGQVRNKLDITPQEWNDALAIYDAVQLAPNANMLWVHLGMLFTAIEQDTLTQRQERSVDTQADLISLIQLMIASGAYS